MEGIIDKDPRLISAREAYFEKSAFLNEALQNPQRTFDTIVWLSVLAFLVGVSFVVGAFLAGFFGNDTAQKAVLGGLSGGGAAATTIGSVLAISRDSIRKANGDNARLRLILTAFATEITHFRAIPIQNFRHAQQRNREIREATMEAVRKIEEYAEPKEKEPEEKKPKDQKPEDQKPKDQKPEEEREKKEEKPPETPSEE